MAHGERQHSVMQFTLWMSQSYSISQTTLRKRWKISAALSAPMTFRFSKRQTMYKSYFILFVVFFFLVCSRFCLITVICSDSVLFLCSREAEYTRLGRECEALCVLTWWMCKSLNLFWYLDQSYLYVLIFCTCSLSENISVSSKPITFTDSRFLSKTNSGKCLWHQAFYAKIFK